MSNATLAKVRYSEAERATGTPMPETVGAAVRAVQENGAVYLENVLDAGLIAALYAEIFSRYGRYFKEDLYDDVLHVGNRRMMISVEINGVFNQSKIYGNSLMMPVLRGLLGPRFVMGGFGTVVSLPGARAQHIHRDHPELFGNFDHEHHLPAFALTIAIPLIDMDTITGTTRLIPGSHRASVERAKSMAWMDPVVSAGSVLIWDYLLFHGGTANLSDRVRPLLYFSYCRPWFMDSENYRTHDPLSLTVEEFEKIADDMKPLFQWAMPRTAPDWSRMLPDMPCPCFSGLAYKNCHGGKKTKS